METSVFAQRLAANEQPRRDRAVKKLRRYIAVRTAKRGFSQEELLQLWKGLHYCFWMQDKPVLQEELSAKLCGLLKAFPDGDSALAFAAAFFTTQAKEWGRLDQWRMDKFMMLIRDFLHATFEVVKKDQWQERQVGAVSSLVGDVMDAGKEDFPDGFRLHLADIYLEELEKVGSDELNGDQINVLLEPFLQYIVHSKRDVIANKVIAKVFSTVVEAAATEKQNHEDEDATPTLQFNYKGLQKMLFDAGRQKNILPKVRRKIYKLVKRFSEAGVEGTGSEATQVQGKRKHTDEKAEEPKKKKTKTNNEERKQNGMQEKNQASAEEKRRADAEEKRLADTEENEKEITQGPSRADQAKAPTPKKAKKPKKDGPETTPKHVAFDLGRNSSRGLQEFVKNVASTSSPSPFLPTRSPSHGILKDSPQPASSSAEKAGSSPNGDTRHRATSHKKGKHHKKGKTAGEWSSAIGKDGKLVAKRLKGDGRGGAGVGGERSPKFASKKKGKVMKKPKFR